MLTYLRDKILLQEKWTSVELLYTDEKGIYKGGDRMKLRFQLIKIHLG